MNLKISFWEAFFDWLAKKLPPLLAAFGLGYKLGKQEVAEKENEIKKISLELQKEKNADEIRNSVADKSDADLVRDSIRDGGDS